MKKIFLVQWGLSDYDPPQYQVYLWADSEEEAQQRAIQEEEAYGEMIIEEIIPQ